MRAKPAAIEPRQAPRVFEFHLSNCSVRLTIINMPLDHILLRCPTNLLAAELNFLNTALAPLGIKEQFGTGSELFAFGDEQNPRFLWVSCLDRDQQAIQSDKPLGIHIAFKAKGGFI